MSIYIETNLKNHPYQKAIILGFIPIRTLQESKDRTKSFRNILFQQR